MSRLVKKKTNYGTIEAEYYVNIIDGKEVIEGEYKHLTDKGLVRGITNYVNGKKHGPCIRFFVSDGELNGNISRIKYYENDKLEGEYISYNELNQINKHCYYLNGELHGEYKETHGTHWTKYNHLYIHCFYKHGKLDGKKIEYHNPNSPTSQNNGCIKEISDSYIDGNLFGSQKRYNNEGKLISIQYYNKSCLLFQFEIHDKRYKFGTDDETEKILALLYDKFTEHINNHMFINPLPLPIEEPIGENSDDEQEESDEEKSVDYEAESDDEQEESSESDTENDCYNDGEYRKYYNNGNIKKIGNYYDGSKHGEFMYYNENGELDEIVNYSYGCKDGKYYKYNNDNQRSFLEYECSYYRDEYMGECLVDSYITYYPNGQIKDIHNYDHDRLDGEYTEYYETEDPTIEKIKTTGNYQNGYKYGYEYKYDENGVLISKIFIDENCEEDS